MQLLIQIMRMGSLGTLHTLEMAKEKGARYVLVSTSEVYGDPCDSPGLKRTITWFREQLLNLLHLVAEGA